MDNDQKTLIIADDHPIFRLGLRNILAQIPWIRIVGEAETGTSALTQLKHLQPDLLLLDLEMPGMDGLTVLKEMAHLQLDTLAVILTSYDDDAYLEKALDLGARAYVLKDEAGDSLKACLDAVCTGAVYISPSFGNHTRMAPVRADSDLIASLTETERVILSAVGGFKTSKEIAAEMDISYRTVQNHRASICRKLGLKGAHQLMQFARDNVQE